LGSSRPAKSYAEIAKREGVTRRYVGHTIPLAFIAPEIVAAILAGDQPIELTAETVTKRIDFALGWPEQRAQLGFD